METSQVEDALRNCEFFKSMDITRVSEISALGRVEVFEAGEDIFRQGDFGEKIYVIAEGHVYLDYTGGGLFGQSQVQRHHD